MRPDLEQAVIEKLENLGVKPVSSHFQVRFRKPNPEIPPGADAPHSSFVPSAAMRHTTPGASKIYLVHIFRESRFTHTSGTTVLSGSYCLLYYYIYCSAKPGGI